MNKPLLVIFDLDETLIHSDDQHEDFTILSKMHDKGYILAIASRNDYYKVIEILHRFSIHDYFRYIMADFRPKVYQVREIVKLSHEDSIDFKHVIFIDDYLPNIQRINSDEPDVITYHFRTMDMTLTDLSKSIVKFE